MTNNNPSSTPSSYHLTFDYERYNNKYSRCNLDVLLYTNESTRLCYLYAINRLRCFSKTSFREFLSDSQKVIDCLVSGKLSYNDKDSFIFVRDEYLDDPEANYKNIVEDTMMMAYYKLAKKALKVYQKLKDSNMTQTCKNLALETHLDDIVSKYLGLSY
jgi:hypothetical protein